MAFLGVDKLSTPHSRRKVLKYLYSLFQDINMVRKLPDLVGQKFHCLTVIRNAGKTDHGKTLYFCECDCGGSKTAAATNLITGSVKSCGCQRGRKDTHGMSKTNTYRIYQAMKNRCYNPKNKAYKSYGGREITICDRWLESFENFYEDMGECPQGYSIERKDVDSDYEPNNCEWILINDQGLNKTSNRFITFEGQTKCLSQWAEEKNILAATIADRIDKRGWSLDKALNSPVRKGGGRKNICFLTFQGLTLNLQEWSKKTGIKVVTIQSRLSRNWSIEDALTINPNRSLL
jgi:hypothetical protein